MIPQNCFANKLQTQRCIPLRQDLAFKSLRFSKCQHQGRHNSVPAFAGRPAGGGRQGGRSLDVGGSAKEELQQGPQRSNRLDSGGSAREEATQNGGLQRPQRQQSGWGGPKQGGRGPSQQRQGSQQQQPQQGNRPQGNRPQGNRPQGNRPGAQRPAYQQTTDRPVVSRKREAAQANKSQELDRPAMNEEISYPEVRVLDNKKEPIGVMPTSQALQMAMEQNVDLILLNPEAQPPLVRLAPLSKLKYEQAKKEKDQRKKQREARSDLKELRFRPNTEEHDYNVRLNHAKRHLSKGDKVKLTMRFKGREMEYQNLGRDMFKRFISDLGDEASVQKNASMQGNQMTLILGPKAV